MAKRNGIYFLEGIYSFGTNKCGQGYPSIYTSIKHYMPWIIEKIPYFEERCKCGNSLDEIACNSTIVTCGPCKPGFFDDFCQSECKCDNSLNGNVCDLATGKCSSQCKPEFFGDFCTGK